MFIEFACAQVRGGENSSDGEERESILLSPKAAALRINLNIDGVASSLLQSLPLTRFSSRVEV